MWGRGLHSGAEGGGDCARLKGEGYVKKSTVVRGRKARPDRKEEEEDQKRNLHASSSSSSPSAGRPHKSKGGLYSCCLQASDRARGVCARGGGREGTLRC